MRIVLPLLCLFAVVCTIPLTAGDAKPAPKVAVLRLQEVINNCKYYSTRVEGLQQEQNEIKKTLKEMDEKLKQYDNQLGVLAPTNERYPQIQEESKLLELKFKLTRDRSMGAIDRRHAAIIKETFGILRQHLKDYSKERGIQMVHLAPNGELKAPSAAEMGLELGLQSLLYFDESLDITTEFIQFVNAKYAAEKPAAEGQGTGK
jgi:Skp family chaperone for outer membrane proteins